MSKSKVICSVVLESGSSRVKSSFVESDFCFTPRVQINNFYIAFLCLGTPVELSWAYLGKN